MIGSNNARTSVVVQDILASSLRGKVARFDDSESSCFIPSFRNDCGMSTDKSNRKGHSDEETNEKEQRYSSHSHDDNVEDRKMPGFSSLQSTTNATIDLNRCQYNDQITRLISSNTSKESLGEAHALFERQRQQVDSVSKTVAHTLAARQEHFHMDLLRNNVIRNYLQDAQKETIYHGVITGDSATRGLPSSTALDLIRRKRPLEEDILMAQREHMLKRARQQEEECIWLNNIRREEMLVSAQQDHNDFLNSLLSGQNNIMPLALSRLNPNGPLSRMNIFNKESSTLPLVPQSSRLQSILGDSTSSRARGLNPSNESTLNPSGLGGRLSQAHSSLSSMYGANVSTLAGSNSLSNIFTAVPNTIPPFPTTPNMDLLHHLNVRPPPTPRLTASSHQQVMHPFDSRETGVDSLEGDNDSIDPRADQKRFNKHQCKQWTVKYQELLDFKAKEGHCNVPHLYKENRGLAMWVKRQRHQHNLRDENKASTLTNERIKLLERIGFVWNCLDTAWEKNFEDLRIFSQCNGHCSVPPTYQKNPRLSSWVITQRRQCKLLEDGKSSSMTQKRFEKLQQIGFPVFTKKSKKSPGIQ